MRDSMSLSASDLAPADIGRHDDILLAKNQRCTRNVFARIIKAFLDDQIYGGRFVNFL
jgi:hypothetical protein